MKLTKFSFTDFSNKKNIEQIANSESDEYIDDDIDTPLRQILGKMLYEESSFDNILSGEPQAGIEEEFEHSEEDNSLEEGIRKVLKEHNIPINDSILSDLIETARENLSLSVKQEQKDPVLQIIDSNTPLSYWKKECSELFDYPEKMHGYKTSWEFLKGVYKPNKHKILYYNDLKEINHKLYRAIYRRNNKEKFLPTHNDRVAKEVKLMKSNNIGLSDIKDPKLREKYRMRFQHSK